MYCSDYLLQPRHLQPQRKQQQPLCLHLQPRPWRRLGRQELRALQRCGTPPRPTRKMWGHHFFRLQQNTRASECLPANVRHVLCVHHNDCHHNNCHHNNCVVQREGRPNRMRNHILSRYMLPWQLYWYTSKACVSRNVRHLYDHYRYCDDNDQNVNDGILHHDDEDVHHNHSCVHGRASVK